MVFLCCAMAATANAQFGNLLKKAKKVADKVNVTTTTNSGSTGSSSASRFDDPEYVKKERMKSPGGREEYEAEAAGGMQKYLGLDTPDGEILWKYYNMEFAQLDKRGYYRLANSYSKPLVNMLRFIKGNTGSSGFPRDTKAFFGREQPTREKDLKDKIMTKKDPMPDSELNALKRECARIKALWDALPEEQKNKMYLPSVSQ